MPTSEIYTLSLHDALPILMIRRIPPVRQLPIRTSIGGTVAPHPHRRHEKDRKSTRLNSSHVSISYAVFCLKKKKKSFANSASFVKRQDLHEHADRLLLSRR